MDQSGYADPEREAQLRAAAHGPVVIVNVSRWRCDALIVRTDAVTVCELPDLSLDELSARTENYLRVLRGAESAEVLDVQARRPTPGQSGRVAALRQRQAAQDLEEAYREVDELLTGLQRWMWDTIAEPVLARLDYHRIPDGAPESWPRIWWCPTGLLALLPLHSAGYHEDREAGRTVLDRVVSSYTPALHALLRARESTGDRGSAAADHLLFVEGPDGPGAAPRENSAEREALLGAFPNALRTVLDGEAATPDAVIEALPRHRWVHFSCHGDQDLTDPSQGRLHLHDGALNVARIAAGRFHGDFAGLSACKTAVGGVRLPDEAVTLAAALHYTGYRHVIAALWSVDSHASVEVFSGMYRTIATGGRLEADRAPVALHAITRRLRDQSPDWPHRWTPFVHVGP